MRHTPDRHVSDDEQRLWEEARVEWKRSEFDRISITGVAEQKTGLHPERSRQIVRTWDNEGLVVTAEAGDKASLTEYGRQVTEIVEE